MYIREMRKSKNMTLKDVADFLGISSIQVSRIERNKRGLKVAYAKKLGELFSVDWKMFYEL